VKETFATAATGVMPLIRDAFRVYLGVWFLLLRLFEVSVGFCSSLVLLFIIGSKSFWIYQRSGDNQKI
jgi:hypothetical protein